MFKIDPIFDRLFIQPWIKTLVLCRSYRNSWQMDVQLLKYDNISQVLTHSHIFSKNLSQPNILVDSFQFKDGANSQSIVYNEFQLYVYWMLQYTQYHPQPQTKLPTGSINSSHLSQVGNISNYILNLISKKSHLLKHLHQNISNSKMSNGQLSNLTFKTNGGFL